MLCEVPGGPSANRKYYLPPEFPGVAFLKLSNESIGKCRDFISYSESQDDDIDMERGNPLTDFPPKDIAVLLPQNMLAQTSLGPDTPNVVKRRYPGKSFQPKREAQEPPCEPQKTKKHNLLVEKHGNFNYLVGNDDCVGETARKNKDFIELGNTERRALLELDHGEDWVNHFWVEVQDYGGTTHGEDLDRWTKPCSGDDASSIAAFKIDWSLTDNELADWFRAWLRKHRSQEEVSNKGRTDYQKKLRLDLVRLASLRVYCDTGTFPAAAARCAELPEIFKPAERANNAKDSNYESRVKKQVREVT